MTNMELEVSNLSADAKAALKRIQTLRIITKCTNWITVQEQLKVLLTLNDEDARAVAGVIETARLRAREEKDARQKPIFNLGAK
jgi:hypothetical protein